MSLIVPGFTVSSWVQSLIAYRYALDKYKPHVTQIKCLSLFVSIKVRSNSLKHPLSKYSPALHTLIHSVKTQWKQFKIKSKDIKSPNMSLSHASLWISKSWLHNLRRNRRRLTKCRNSLNRNIIIYSCWSKIPLPRIRSNYKRSFF